MVSSVPFPSSFRHPSTIPLDGSQIFSPPPLFFFITFFSLFHYIPSAAFSFILAERDSFPVNPSNESKSGQNYNSVVSTTSITTSKRGKEEGYRPRI